MIERTFDYRRISRLTPWWPVISKKIIYLIETDGQRDYGVWSFREHFDESVIIHANLSKACRGQKAIESGKNAFKWIFDNTEFKTIHAEVSMETKDKKGIAVCLMARKAGMLFTHFQNNKRYFQVNKNGLSIGG